MKQQEQRVDFDQMVDEGWRAAIRLMNGQAGAGLVWQVVNAADCLRHPELFQGTPDFSAIPAKKLHFIQRVARLYADGPFAPERGLP